MMGIAGLFLFLPIYINNNNNNIIIIINQTNNKHSQTSAFWGTPLGQSMTLVIERLMVSISMVVKPKERALLIDVHSQSKEGCASHDSQHGPHTVLTADYTVVVPYAYLYSLLIWFGWLHDLEEMDMTYLFAIVRGDDDGPICMFMCIGWDDDIWRDMILDIHTR